MAERPRTIALVLQADPVKLCQPRLSSTAIVNRAHEVHARHRQQNLFVLVVPAVDLDAPFRHRVRRGCDPDGARKYPRGNVALFPGRQMSIVARWQNRRVGFARDYRICRLCRRTPSKYANLAEATGGASAGTGYMRLRGLLPMNMRRKVTQRELSPEASADVARLEQAFGQARMEFGEAGAFLFGDFSAADAMFAPVVNRLHV